MAVTREANIDRAVRSVAVYVAALNDEAVIHTLRRWSRHGVSKHNALRIRDAFARFEEIATE